MGFEFGGANARNPELAYWTGVAYAGRGETQKAAEQWKRAAAPPESASERRANQFRRATGSPQAYYQGLALQKLGETEKAQALFQGLVQSGQNGLKEPAPAGDSRPGRGELSPRVRSANAHYLEGLGYLGLKDQAHAKDELSQAVRMSPDLVGARAALSSLE